MGAQGARFFTFPLCEHPIQIDAIVARRFFFHHLEHGGHKAPSEVLITTEQLPNSDQSAKIYKIRCEKYGGFRIIE